MGHLFIGLYRLDKSVLLLIITDSAELCGTIVCSDFQSGHNLWR